jgi:metal-sulfur cluster biosynthetic enzyme
MFLLRARLPSKADQSLPTDLKLKATTDTLTHKMPRELEPVLYDKVEEALKEVIDPEIGVNIVDLGLIYGLEMADEDESLLINMTLTSAGCPLTDVLEEQTAEALDGVVDAFRINWVWMPPWGPEKITEDGREQMRAIGFSI